LRAGIKAADFQAELFKKELREELGRSFPHPDHSDIRAANHAHRQRGDLSLECNRRKEAGTAPAENDDVLNHEEMSAT
jgi:hypothetical protein